LNFEIRTPRLGYEKCIVALHEKEGADVLEYLDVKTGTWTLLTDVPDEHARHKCKLCCIEDNIYLVGGIGDGGRSVTEYNPRSNTWRTMPSLQQGREIDHSVCTLDKKMFVLGGYGHGVTCEMLDLSDDDPQWRFIANMNNSHYSGGAALIERKVYVMDCYFTEHVEEYDIDQDQWNIVTNVPISRCMPVVAALDNKIYVTGGDGEVGKLVACYDPVTNTWSQVADMNMARYGHSLVCLNGRLFAIGGVGVDSVEVYDPDNDTWTLQQDKLDGRVFDGGAGLIRKEILIKK